MTKLIQRALLAAILACAFAASAQAGPLDPLPYFRPIVIPAPARQALTPAPAPVAARAQPAG